MYYHTIYVTLLYWFHLNVINSQRHLLERRPTLHKADGQMKKNTLFEKPLYGVNILQEKSQIIILLHTAN